MQHDVVAGFRDDRLQVVDPGSGEPERLTEPGDRLANNDHVLGRRRESQSEFAARHDGVFPPVPEAATMASSSRACTGSSVRRPVTSRTRSTASEAVWRATAKPILASAASRRPSRITLRMDESMKVAGE